MSSNLWACSHALTKPASILLSEGVLSGAGVALQLIHIGMALHAGGLMLKAFFPTVDPVRSPQHHPNGDGKLQSLTAPHLQIVGLLVILFLTSVYTLAGGLRAGVHTEFAQVYSNAPVFRKANRIGSMALMHACRCADQALAGGLVRL